MNKRVKDRSVSAITMFFRIKLDDSRGVSLGSSQLPLRIHYV